MTNATAEKLAQDIDGLMASYTRLIRQCHDMLAPDADPKARAELRTALASFLENADGVAKRGTDS